MQNYWCRHFILPAGVIKKINSICSHFFWKGDAHSAKGARVSWSFICHPKAEGGLGIKESISWNRACILQNIWAIFAKTGSLWIAWIEAYILKGRDFWSMVPSQSSSWSWRKLLQLRPLALSFTENKNGRKCWKLKGDKYSAKVVWNEIRPKQSKKDWSRLLWTSLTIPKHVLLSWMALLDRLPTQDRLEAWGMEVDGTCLLCSKGKETRDHLFYGCDYSKYVWSKLLQMCGLSRPVMDWNSEIKWATKKLKGKALLSVTLRLAWRAHLYYIWRERNRRLFKKSAAPADHLIEQIKEVIQLRMYNLGNITDDHVNRLLCTNWELNIL